MKLQIRLIVFSSIFLLFSCEKALMHKEPRIDNVSVFNEYAKICIEKFGLQDVKGIDLKVITDSVRPLITWDLTQEEMFEALGYIVNRMQEGHTNLQTIDYNFLKGYYWFNGFPAATKYPIPDKYYYGPEANTNVQYIQDDIFDIKYGFLTQAPEIGYIRVLSFSMDVSVGELETMMSFLKNAKGIIIDVRGNLGGYIDFASKLSSYFTFQEVGFGTNYIKNGPGKNDFAASKLTLKPSNSSYTYTKPVIVLQDRITFSSGSLFCVMMSELPNVKTLGQIFGGGTGDIIDGFLANGWKYTISTSNLVNASGKPTDNGIEPDIQQLINPADTDKDALIDRAILELQ